MGKPVSGRKSYPASPTDYQLMEEIGDGASATVYRAICIPFNEIVAVKCLDLDRCNSNLEDMRREAQTMSLIDHPNVIKAYCSFVVDRCLWVVMPFMAQGSCLHIMKIAYPDGFEEAVICSLLKETLKALDYLHKHGHIHRDVKAGNILLDSTGFVKVGDFGVSACMFDKGDRQRSRNTFVGTPCWMAPEVLQSGSGYDFKADIWSFGITALELAHGHAPFSKYPPMKVLLMTLQNAPPGLDYERDKRFSKSFKEMVAMCLVKDQSKRPTAEKLLKHSFFKNAKPPESTLKKLLVDLPPLWDRVKALQLKDAAELAMKKMPSAEQEAISQSEYKRGVSAWNFDIEDLKAQASLIRDDDELPGVREEDMEPRPAQKEKASPSSLSGKPAFRHEIVRSESIGDASSSEGRHLNAREKITLSKSAELDSGGPSEIQCLVSKDEIGKNVGAGDVKIGEGHALNDCDSGQPMPTSERGLREANDRSTPEKALKHDAHKDSSLNGPMMLPRRASMNSLSAPIRSSGGYRDSVEDKSKANVVQVKGRFSVMSENVDVVKAATSKETGNVPIATSVLVPQLQNLFQQTAVQQDLIMNLINSLQQTAFADGKCSSQVPTFGIDTSNEAAPSERERQLLTKISDLQNRVLSLTDDLTTERAKYIHLQHQLNDFSTQEKFGNSNGNKTST